MTSEQSKHIRSVEHIIDRLNERIEKIKECDFFDKYPQGFSDGCNIDIIGEFKADMSKIGKEVRDFALAELKKLQDKYLQIYAEL